MRHSLHSLIAAAAIGVFPTATSLPDSPVAFVNVSVIPMDRERMLPNQTVLVRGGRITAMGPAAQVPIPKEAIRIDGQGKFLMPGLGDMHTHVHVHFRGKPAADSLLLERMLFLFLANGVTTIRNMEELKPLTLREKAAKGDLLSPRIYSSGRRLSFKARTPTAGVTTVAREQAAGYDFLKIYQLDLEAFDSLVAAATRAGMPFSGHVPSGVPIERALAAGYRSIEHFTGYLSHLNGDDSKIPAIAAATQRAGVWNVPTYLPMANILTATEELAARPEMRYVTDRRLQAWESEKRGAIKNGDTMAVERWRQTVESSRKLIKGMHDAGAGLLLGTDAPDFFVVPGFSIHRELQALVAAGLTPYQALETGTRNVAVFFGTLDSTGTVAVGKRADLILVSGNPLVDIGHTAVPAGVMIGGRWLSRADIDTRLGSIEKTFE